MSASARADALITVAEAEYAAARTKAITEDARRRDAARDADAADRRAAVESGE